MEYLTKKQHNLVLDILYAEIQQNSDSAVIAKLTDAIDRLEELMIELGYGKK